MQYPSATLTVSKMYTDFNVSNKIYENEETNNAEKVN